MLAVDEETFAVKINTRWKRRRISSFDVRTDKQDNFYHPDR